MPRDQILGSKKSSVDLSIMIGNLMGQQESEKETGQSVLML